MWIITILSIVGVVANIYKKRWGFGVWIFTNSTWAYIDFKHGLPAQGWLFIIYTILAIWGLIKWRK